MARAGKVNLFQLTHSHCFESATSVTKSNQYFAYYRSECFSPAAGLPNQGSDLALSDRVPRALRSEDVMDDVFCMVKERMATDGLCQAPLLCLPGSLLQQSQQMLRRANDPQCPVQTCHLESDRRDELRTLKFAMGKDFPHLTRAASFYESMIASASREPGGVPQLTFLRRASTDGRRDWGAVGIGQRPRVPKPYELQVVFHRARV